MVELIRQKESSTIPDIFSTSYEENAGNLTGIEIAPEIIWGLLIVDNGSRDETAQIIEREITRGRLPLVHMNEPTVGKSRALNLALSKSRSCLFLQTTM